MVKFEHPLVLLFLIAAVGLLLWFIFSEFRRNKQMKAFGNIKLLATLMPTRSLLRQRLKFALAWIAFVALIMVVARIQFAGNSTAEGTKLNVEMVAVVDVSNSMLCTDETPSRLEKAKIILNAFIDNSEHTKMGLVEFAGTSVTRMPITSDLGSAKMFVNSMSTEDVSVQGTAIGVALRQAQRCFSKEEGVARCILLFTDAENHEDDAVATAEAVNREVDVVVNVVGLGSREGATIPLGDSLLINLDGDTVITRFDENMAKNVAKSGKGIYMDGSSPADIVDKVMSQLEKKAKSSTKVSSSAVTYTDKFQIFAFVAFFCLLVDVLLMERKNRLMERLRGLFQKKSEK
ncbi:MAG: VWA domain-containing protein [Paludibacteraceae bacterium]|nr:VWA domain-containing protein [Paludibacteraceae bacterium]